MFGLSAESLAAPNSNISFKGRINQNPLYNSREGKITKYINPIVKRRK